MYTKNPEIINVDGSSLSVNNRLVWIHGKSNTPKHHNTYSHNRKIDNLSTKSTKYNKETTDNLLQAKKTYTVINITFDGLSKEEIQIIDQPQKKINRKINDCYLKKKKNNNDDCSLAPKDEKDFISTTDQHTKLLDNPLLTDCTKNMIQKENDNEFDIVFLNNQHQLEIQTINI
ncbi:uncharacterized protein LOC132920116 isoform X2 [Rhopalosiphum padi]|uniref:uncharacterized protein LOC132920116 isoform X2 n=1 Tax=Rhopalosiphum padi TaxID=40932 RepID=UPI00298E85BA|nr:uncharacterized protein LOC132920116 isoform X2 [Rhopalosiphum padi]